MSAQTAPQILPCTKQDRHANLCLNPSLTAFGLCLRHLREAAAEWQRAVGAAIEQTPGSVEGAIYDATAAERRLA